jgi:hypothetical protein
LLPFGFDILGNVFVGHDETPDGWILDAGYWKLDTGSWILEAGYWKLNVSCVASFQLLASSF